MADSSSSDQEIPRVLGDPEQIQSQLQELEELAWPLKSTWEEKYLAVFSCGVDGRVFRPEGVGRPQDEKIDEDLRQVSPLLRKIANQLKSIRPDGGRFFLHRTGAFTWDASRSEIVCFLRFPGAPTTTGGSDTDQPDTTQTLPSPDSGMRSDAGTDEDEYEPISKKEFVNRLTEIPRLGRRKARALWRHGFRSIEEVVNAPVRDLTQVRLLGSKIARRIKSKLDGPESRTEVDAETSAEGSSRSSVQGSPQSTSVEDFRKPYSIFQADPLEQLRVETIRASATNLREMVRSHRVPDVETFSSAVYRYETETNINDRDLSGALFNPWIAMPEGLIRELHIALNEERASLSGNYLWGGDYAFAEHLDDDRDRQSIIEESFRLLGLSRIAPVEQAERIADLPGFGPVSASGLVTMCRPDRFTLFYQRPFEMMGIDVDSLQDLSGWFPTVRDRLGAADGLELARFVRLLQDEGFEMLLRRHNANT